MDNIWTEKDGTILEEIPEETNWSGREKMGLTGHVDLVEQLAAALVRKVSCTAVFMCNDVGMGPTLKWAVDPGRATPISPQQV
ncbi:hypothetical protein RvY_16319 [Ramazzottius varieornatus]|uniref:Uncharacterized protein n=1 Tax=Ramazzottius varieornatus TaxID=947166 RepID=A0A1D1VY18_RAMVA|nr:hypothetical protein RvY_16319 [Ramazzottius varieornatus]